MIRLRIDVDYPYPSRIKSFICTLLGIRLRKDYLKNSKIIARMINESAENVKAYWFFTPKTMPDKELMELMENSKHELALHVVNDPNEELQYLENVTGKKVNYFTIHGTARILARIMWKRWRAKAPKIPADFQLRSFHQFPTVGIDALCYSSGIEKTVNTVKDHIKKDTVLYFHPIWLFQRGKLNRRGPFYEAFKRILYVDKELETIAFRKRFFFKIAKDTREYEKDVNPTEELLKKLRERGADIFTLLERRWCHKISLSSKLWTKTNDNIGLLNLKDYEEWWTNIGKKTRNMVRKAEKSGITIEVAAPTEKLAEGIWKIYNETPIRQERGFPHYGAPLQAVKEGVLSSQNCTYIAAWLQNELAGFTQLVHGENVVIISQILSLQKHWDKAVNNSLVAKVIEACASRHIQWIMYGRMGNHPSLDKFKQSNGFTQFQLTRYFIPLTKKGRIAVVLGLHRELKDTLPQSTKYPLIPIYNWISRTRMKMKLFFKPRQII